MLKLVVDHALTYVSGNFLPLEVIKKPLHYTEKMFMRASTKNRIAKAGGKFSNQPMLVDKYLFDEFDNSFPTGMLPKVIQLLDQQQFAYDLVDLRAETHPSLSFGLATGKYKNLKPREYQKEAIDTALFKKRGILRIACGGGKTLCAGEVIKGLKRRTVFLVNRGGLLYQAKEVFEQMLGVPIGQVGDGIVDIQEVNVVMLQTLVKYLGKEYDAFDEEDFTEDPTDTQKYAKQIQEMLDSTEVLFLDECHCIGARTAYDSMAAFKSAEWKIGLSATPRREDGKDIFFEACIGPRLADVSFTFLIDKGFLVKPYICFVKLDGRQLPANTRARHNTIYQRSIVNNDYRNMMAISEAQNLIIDGHKPLILVQHVKHGNLLHGYFPESEFIHGKHNIEQRKQTLKDFSSGVIPSVIATTILDEAIDIPACDSVIMAGGGASYVRTIQRMSRAMRLDPNNPNKKHCVIIDFFDEDKYLERHCYVRQNTYRSERAFEIILPGQARPFEDEF